MISPNHLVVLSAFAFICSVTLGQPPSPPQFDSVEVDADRSIMFRLHAPNAKVVHLVSGDLPDVPFGRGVELTKNDEVVWSSKIDPVPAGAYRYHFNVDGVTVVDPRSTTTSGSNSTTWSLVVVPGSDVLDDANGSE